MKQLIKTTYVYNIDNEDESARTIQDFKDKQLTEGYTVLKSKVDYKTKKDRKSGDIIEEKWVTEVTIAYEV